MLEKLRGKFCPTNNPEKLRIIKIDPVSNDFIHRDFEFIHAPDPQQPWLTFVHTNKLEAYNNSQVFLIRQKISVREELLKWFKTAIT